MIDAMHRLVQGARPHDSLFFHCTSQVLNQLCMATSVALDSGHGGQTPDLDGDEIDGFDEGVYHDHSIVL
jgi:hypothetical protein